MTHIPPEDYILSDPADLRKWLISLVSVHLKDLDMDTFDPAENLLLYGLDSLHLMALAAALEGRGLPVTLEALVETPTINAWVALAHRARPVL